jgi:hypothetical protein
VNSLFLTVKAALGYNLRVGNCKIDGYVYDEDGNLEQE